MSHERDHDEGSRFLLTAALDGELDAAQRAELDRRLAADPRLRAEWDRLSKLKELTKMSTISNPPEEQWGTYWQSVYNRIERGLGWILVSLGATVLVIFGLWEALREMLADSDVPEFVKLAILALGAGGVLLLFSVIREKLFVRRHDPYEEVER